MNPNEAPALCWGFLFYDLSNLTCQAMQSDRKIYNLDEARVVIRKFCAYQERSQKQVRDRLYKMGLISDAVELLISECIEENYLNEERFAMAFVRGKYKFKDWGRQRLERELKFQNVSDYCIRKAMAQLDDEDYDHQLKVLAQKKWDATKDANRFSKGKKVVNFLIRKGYESDKVWEEVRRIMDSSSEDDQ